MKTERRVIAAFIGILCVVSVLALTSNNVPGLVREKFSDEPIRSQPHWLEGMRAYVRSPRLVHSSKADGDGDYYFKGDTSAFNEFLRKFAAVKLPKHRIAIKKQYGKVSHRHFDWVLHIPGQTNSKGGKDREAKDVYPSVTVYAAASDIHLADVVLPEGADVVVLESGDEDHWRVVKGVETARKWALAGRKWLEFIGPYLSRIRQEEHKPSIQCVEVRSVLISEYLSEHKIYVVETRRGGRSSTFAMSITGEITDLGSGDWMGRKGEKHFRNRKLSGFLDEQRITVSDHKTAIGVMKLVEKISSAPNDATLLRRNTNNFTIFDKRLYPRSHHTNWEYSAERQNGSWAATRKYVGPPAMIMKPRKWEIMLDKNDRFVEMRYQ